MSDREELRQIVEEIDYMLAERRRRAVERPRIAVVHGHHQPETDCLHGETVEQVYLAFGTREVPLHLSPTGLLIFDCLARHRGTPLSAAQIERILSSDPFYLRHGANAIRSERAAVRPRSASIKVYIQRIRVQLGRALREFGLNLKPDTVLISETTDSNMVMYRLKASVEFRHRQSVLAFKLRRQK
jgi:DNA-binding response OmpR family regulator